MLKILGVNRKAMNVLDGVTSTIVRLPVPLVLHIGLSHRQAVISTQAISMRYSSLSSLTIHSTTAQEIHMGIWQNLLHDAFT